MCKTVVRSALPFFFFFFFLHGIPAIVIPAYIIQASKIGCGVCSLIHCSQDQTQASSFWDDIILKTK